MSRGQCGLLSELLAERVAVAPEREPPWRARAADVANLRDGSAAARRRR